MMDWHVKVNNEADSLASVAAALYKVLEDQANKIIKYIMT